MTRNHIILAHERTYYKLNQFLHVILITFDTTTQTLKGNTKMCYGKHGDNMVIITKKLTGFYGTAESITTPMNPIALDSDITETQKEYDEKIKREKDYLELLKRLYLPAI